MYKTLIEANDPLETTMTATRPSFILMTTFVAAAAALFLVAATPFLHAAASVIA